MWEDSIKITARKDNGAGKPDVEIELLDDSAYFAYLSPEEAIRFANALIEASNEI